MSNMKRVELIEAVCELSNARKSRPFTFSVDRGEVVLLRGLLEAEKTAVLHLISGLSRPVSGQVLIEGKCINDYTTRQREDLRMCIGLLMPAFPLPMEGTVLQNVEELVLAANESPEKANHQALTALKRFGISELAQQSTNNLPPTQHLLVQLARALVNRPFLVLVDDAILTREGLDAQKIVNSLAMLCLCGTTIIIASDTGIVPQDVVFREIQLNTWLQDKG